VSDKRLLLLLKLYTAGADDGGVRVWSLRTRALMLQFTEHQRSAVTRILVDVQSPNLVHSSGLDGSVFTYDLKTERRVNTHNVSA
jgi:cilia- and flagella-associated protein 52